MTKQTTEAESKKTASKLDSDYLSAESTDKEVFAEMRSGLLLVAGEHYAKKDSNFYRRIRDTKELNKEQKLRLVKNHTRKICQIYANNISSAAPSVGFSAKDEKNQHDVKVAELHKSVWQDAYERYKLEQKMDEWVDSFVQIGEVHLKIFFDPSKGTVTGYEQEMDDQGQPVFDEQGMPVADDSKPVMSGEFVFEEVYGFNLLRPPEAKSLDDAEWLGVRKMVDREILIKQFPDKKNIINDDVDETYTIFDVNKGGYEKSSKQTMLREFYYRPSQKYPNGYFYITTKAGTLAEGELPAGIFPIVTQCFDKLKTTPRGRSPIKTMRPYQAEINRAASKIAEHQITVGDDKLLIQNGTKISAGATVHGIKAVSVTGVEPKFLSGRDGSQYLAYMQANITEMYQVMMVAEDSEFKESNVDPYTLLFRSARDKKKFQRYIKGFETFLINVVKTYLQLAKKQLPDDAAIMAVGKSEQVNIQEFRSVSDICYELKIESQADDIETKLGKQLVQNHILQYVGPQLGKDEIGKIIRQMPYVNNEEAFDDLTIDFDAATNDILALDRGEKPPIGQYDTHPYMIKKLSLRMRKADFKFLSPEIQNNYVQKIALHQEFDAKNKMAIQQMEAGFIPMTGALIPVDFYVDVPNSTGGAKQTKVKIPYDALNHLLKMIEAQGTPLNSLADSPQGAQAQVADMVNDSNAQMQQPSGFGAAGMQQ